MLQAFGGTRLLKNGLLGLFDVLSSISIVDVGDELNRARALLVELVGALFELLNL